MYVHMHALPMLQQVSVLGPERGKRILGRERKRSKSWGFYIYKEKDGEGLLKEQENWEKNSEYKRVVFTTLKRIANTKELLSQI